MKGSRWMGIGLFGLSLAHAGSLTPGPDASLNYVEVTNHPVQKAQAFLTDHARDLKLRGDLADLKVESLSESSVGFHVRFQQMKGKLSVRRSGVTVIVNRRNHVVAYQSEYHPTDSRAKAPAFSIPKNQALQQALSTLKLTAAPTRVSIEPKVEVIDGVSRPAYQIRFSAPSDHKSAWEIVMDGDSGVIYHSQSLIAHARAASDANANLEPSAPIETLAAPVGREAAPFVLNNATLPARVFDPNPTILSDSIYGSQTGFLDAQNGNSDFFDRMESQVSLPLTRYQGNYYLAGKYAVITDQELPKNPDCANPDPSMNYRRGDPCFDSVNAYYHITHSLAYLNETLGIVAHPILYTGPVHVDPAGLQGEDDSEYNPLTDELAFGVEGVHGAQDHDTLIHELGHAIHNWLTHGHMSQNEGLSEGIGDYWAASYARTKMKPNNIAYNWVMSFDGHNEFWPGRIVNSNLKYPDGVEGDYAEIHTAGQVWSSTCMEIWSLIGKAKMDKIFWSGIAMLSDDSNQNDAAIAVYAAAKEIYPSNSRLLETIRLKFESRGYRL